MSQVAKDVPEPIATHVPAVLRRTYLATHVFLTLDDEELAARAAVQQLRTPVFVLTAWNPGSERLSTRENRRLNRALRGELEVMTSEVFPAAGVSADGRWREESLAAVGVSRASARRLGRSFGQHAIFELRRNEQRVVGCVDGWMLSRGYNERVAIEDETGPTLPELLDRELGIEWSPTFSNATRRGWTVEADIALPCPECGTSLLLLGCDLLAQDGTPNRETALVCGEGRRVLLPSAVPASYRAVVEALRAYLTASEDADAAGLTDRKYWAYVIELDDGVGPRVNDALPWVYVGQTSLTPEERFAQHLAGTKASRVVHKHRVQLMPELTQHQPILRTSTEAKAYERWLYEWLAATGWSVKGGT